MGTSHAIETCANPSEAVRDRIRALLEERRLRLQAEIVKYPSPIPACDAHFNHLLEERGRITDELARLDGITAMAGDTLKQLDAFLGASHCLDDKTKREIRNSAIREL